MTDASVPSAFLALGTHCPHCPTVLSGLSDLVKQGRIGKLEVVNLDQRPDIATELGIRGVPWVRIGPFELEGLRSPAELKTWVERAGTLDGMAEYFRELLNEGKLDQVSKVIDKDPFSLEALLHLLADPDTELQIRLGLSAIIEDYAGTPTLQAMTDKLGRLSEHEDARIRNDACYFLGLSNDRNALPYLKARLQDESQDVRDTAEESLEELGV